MGITDKFLAALHKGGEYELTDPVTNKAMRKVKARKIYDMIVDAAWTNGEPGIVFLDRLNKANAVPALGEIDATNPCGEQPLLPYESCNLGSINLKNMLKQGADGYEIDYDKLKKRVIAAVHFLDNIIDINKYPLKLIDENTRLTRKIGLGVMGFADMLLRLKIAYNSPEALRPPKNL